MKLGVFLICTFGGTILAQEPMSHTSQTGGQLALNDAVAAALENNPSIKTARAKWESARQRIPQAAAWEDPKRASTRWLVGLWWFRQTALATKC